MHILIVEDNALVASGMRAGLELYGFTCDVAPDAASARACMDGARHAIPYAACVLDLGLPDGDGMQLLQLARVESASSAETPETQGAAIAQAVRLALQQSQQCAQTEQGAHAPVQLVQTPADMGAWQHIAIALPPALLTCAVTNLLDNALRHAATEVSLRAWAAEGQVGFAVEDDGPGIAPEDRERIFESFYTANHGLADSHRSVGLGLSLCRSIALAHGGSIEVAAADPHGSVFTIELPAADVSFDKE